MDLDFFPGANALVDEELGDISPVVTLELDDVAPLAMLVCVAVAAPSFFEVARQLEHIKVNGETANRS